MAEKPSTTPVEFLAVGYALSTDKKEIVGIQELVDGEPKEPTIWLARSRFRLNPGNVYSIATNAERTAFSRNARWVRQFGNSLRAIDMQMKAKAWDMARAAEKLAKKEGGPTTILEDALAPVKKAYQSMSFSERAACEVWIIRYLQRGT